MCSFFMNLTAKCGGTRHASKGTITSPNYPGSYESNMDCEYRIVVDPNYNIVLNFVTVNLKRRFGNPGVGSSEDKMNNDTYDDTLTVYDIDSFNNTSTYYYLIQISKQIISFVACLSGLVCK